MNDDRILNGQHTIEEAMCRINLAISNFPLTVTIAAALMRICPKCQKRTFTSFSIMPNSYNPLPSIHQGIWRMSPFIPLHIYMTGVLVQQNYMLHMQNSIVLYLPSDYQRL